MSRIQSALQGKKALIPFITCGDPDLKTTARLIAALAESGADLIELGIPFSDPTAEGPVIQQASLRALEQGVHVDDIFEMVREVRTVTEIPLAFMTYANVVFSYGTERFLERCRQLGIDGLILPDVPFEEREEFLPACRRRGIDLISLIAPTSNERIEMIACEASGFIYLVSSLGVTGERSNFARNLEQTVEKIRKTSSVPVMVGFGIHTPQQAAQMASLADGAIVGSAIVRRIAEHQENCIEPVCQFVSSLKDAMETL